MYPYPLYARHVMSLMPLPVSRHRQGSDVKSTDHIRQQANAQYGKICYANSPLPNNTSFPKTSWWSEWMSNNTEEHEN